VLSKRVNAGIAGMAAGHRQTAGDFETDIMTLPPIDRKVCGFVTVTHLNNYPRPPDSAVIVMVAIFENPHSLG